MKLESENQSQDFFPNHFKNVFFQCNKAFPFPM